MDEHQKISGTMQISLEQFEEKYKPIINHILGTTDGEPNAPMGGYGYETFGEELDTVLAMQKVSPKKVWTVIDTCPDEEDMENDCGMAIVAGYHHVNRILYVITEKEWENENIEVNLND